MDPFVCSAEADTETTDVQLLQVFMHLQIFFAKEQMARKREELKDILAELDRVPDRVSENYHHVMMSRLAGYF